MMDKRRLVHHGLKSFSPLWVRRSPQSARTLRVSSIREEFLISPWSELNSGSAHP